ncbi:hypothetical protein GCM10011452_30530 [Gemmobacter lanyuensis]|uniref:AAA+ ATPase domain-containing protein n=1 Tax=Gemmobacter lanyuensis TaxID=1054497 RepID=A0A918IZM6_9RHOB|nr:AAA family ATPase [Gemmobacter lanyuensis]GGW40013.1 hypothetical protein GCM10011452_30530 [Gemmobacter lanyuensis]
MTTLFIPFKTGRLLILADLHHEEGLDPFVMFGLDGLDWDSFDAVIIAGDIADDAARNWVPAIDFLSRYIMRERLCILPGNHDYFCMHLQADDDLHRIAAAADVQFLQKSELHHGATRILASTLWTDFALLGPDSVPQSTAVAQPWMPDYRSIFQAREGADGNGSLPEFITPEDTVEVHRDHRAWLEQKLAQPHFAGPDGETIVITHHGPSMLTAGKLTPQSPAFHSDLSDLIARFNPSRWYFGHSHRRLRAVQGSTVICNVSLGYPEDSRVPGEHPLSELCLFESKPHWPSAAEMEGKVGIEAMPVADTKVDVDHPSTRLPVSQSLGMSRIQIIHARFFPVSETQSVLEQRLTGFLKRWRRRPQSGPGSESGTLSGSQDIKENQQPLTALSNRDYQRITARAERFLECRRRASNLGHLKDADRERLRPLAAGVDVSTIPSRDLADEIAATVHAAMPWMAGATQVIWEAFHDCARSGRPLHFPPILLNGPHGIGKTVWARLVSDQIGVPAEVVNAGSENAGFGVAGVQRGWSNARPGKLIECILRHRMGNPMFFVDEIDKAGTATSDKGLSFSLEAALLSLLEPASNSMWACPFFEVAFDVRHVSWLFATNDISKISPPFLDRCRVVHVEAPTLEQLREFVRRVGTERGLSEDSIWAVLAALDQVATRHRPSLRTVLRLIDKAVWLQSRPRPN